MLQLTAQQLEQLHHHALSCYPEECCGLLLGNDQGGSTQVSQIWSVENSWTEDFLAASSTEQLEGAPKAKTNASRRNRFAIAPIDFLRAQKFARSEKLNVVGIYHSHPNHPAVPSEYDRQIAWSQYSYLIMSVAEDDVTKTRSWKLAGDRQFLEESVTIVD